MSKRAQYYDEAERLYVHDGWEMSRIYEYYKNRVSERSIWQWKEDGQWEKKREKAQKNITSLQEMILTMARNSVQEAIENIDDPQKIYAACAAIGRISQKNFIEMMENLDGKEEDDEGSKKPSMEEAMGMLKKVLMGK